jgi:3-deoxy-D-arabino-heptulosonate 7-phosphate (DAHP) synthase class II
MSPTGEMRVLGLLETLGGEIAEMRGEQNAEHRHINERLHALGANVDVIRESQSAQGSRIASLPCERHARRISEMLKRLGANEDTGRITIVEREATHKVLRMLGRIVLGVFAAAGAVATVVAACYGMTR